MQTFIHSTYTTEPHARYTHHKRPYISFEMNFRQGSSGHCLHPPPTPLGGEHNSQPTPFQAAKKTFFTNPLSTSVFLHFSRQLPSSNCPEVYSVHLSCIPQGLPSAQHCWPCPSQHAHVGPKEDPYSHIRTPPNEHENAAGSWNHSMPSDPIRIAVCQGTESR